jgi:hypothetical protein
MAVAVAYDEERGVACERCSKVVPDGELDGRGFCAACVEAVFLDGAEEELSEYALLDPFVPLYRGVTYDEMRVWARWLDVFTAADIANAMGATVDVGETAVVALLANGVIYDTGDWVPGSDGMEEPVYAYDWPPPGPRHRPRRTPPEVAAVRAFGMMLFDERGVTQRIETGRDMRRRLSTPGARAVLKRKEQNRKRMEDAKAARALEQKQRQQKAQQERGAKAGKWKRYKRPAPRRRDVEDY